MFESGANFTPGAGKWGLSGAISLPGVGNGYVFFVSFGQTTGLHDFDEGITTGGLLRWQSQPAQGLNNVRVMDWIDHNSHDQPIHLFLRTSFQRNGQPTPYTYLGELAYAGHDPDRETPVYFSWRLINWPITDHILTRMQLTIESEGELPWERGSSEPTAGLEPGHLTIVEPPGQADDQEHNQRQFRPRLDINFEQRSSRARALGEQGEKLVVAEERERLRHLGLDDLAERVEHIAATRGDGAGYDVLSFFKDGQEMFIEVKTTTLGPKTDFLITSNEVDFAQQNPEQYRLYRVFDFDTANNSGHLYILEGDIIAQFVLAPTEFRLSLR